MPINNECPADPVGSAVAVYDRTAASYRAEWDGFVTPEMAAVAAAARPDGRVLDAGCGPGRDLAAFNELGVDAVGVDLSSSMVAICAANGSCAQVGDLRHLPHADATFASVWASASLVHLDPTEAAVALGEMRRVCRPGGVLFVSVKHQPAPGARTGWEGAGDNARFFHYWTPAEISSAVTAAGFFLRSAERVGDSKRPEVTWIHVLATAA